MKALKYSLLTIFLAACVPPAIPTLASSPGDRWYQVSSDARVTISIDTTRLKKTSVWVRFVYDSAQTLPENGRQYWTVVRRDEVRCREGAMRAIAVVKYDQIGDIVDSYDFGDRSTFSESVPGTYGEDVLNAACRLLDERARRR